MSVPSKKLSILIVPSTTFCTSVLPNLMRDVDQRNDHGKRADDLSEISEIVEIHGFQLQPGGRSRSIALTYVDSVLELTFVLGGIEMAFGFCDESIVIDLPNFVTADSNAFPRAAGSGVHSG